jgi:hypothetical protein
VGACAISLGATATAGATDYCVSEAACVAAGGTNEGTGPTGLKLALDAAEKHVNAGGPDRVLLGAGNYSQSEGFSYGGDPVLVRGAGVGATVLTRPALSGPSVLTLTSAGSTVQGVTVLIPAHSGLSGATMTAGTMEGDAIESASAANSVFALEISGGVFTHGVVDAISGTGVESRGGEVLYSTIFGGGIGVEALAPSLVKGDRISGGSPVFSYANPLVLEDSLIDLGGTAGHGIEIVGNVNGKALAFLRHVAVVNGKGGTGIFLNAEKENATALLENSIVSEVETPVLVFGEGTGTTASFSADYSSFDVAESEKKTTGGASATLVAEHVLSTLPSFVSPLTGDYHLAPGSPLIDAGTPGETVGLGEFATDIAGNPRIVDGRRDVGPYEYQWRGPAVTAASSKATTDIGANVVFDGAATTVEPGDAVTGYQWVFDDGTSVPAGAVAEHAFLKSGLHTATLTAKDTAGLSSTATVNVKVKAELPVCLIEGGCCEGAACPALSRSIKSLAVKPLAFKAALRGGAIASSRGAQVTYSVTGAVGLADFTVEQVLKGTTNAAGSCVKPHRGLKGRGCTRYSQAKAAFSHISPAGGNHFHLTGRAKGKKLAPGRYLLIGHLASQPHGPFVTANFRILR